MPVDLGIALMPDDAVRDMTVELNTFLSGQYGTSYRLGETYHPHLSLYQSTFAEHETLQQAMQQLRDKDKKVRGAEIKLRNLTMFPSGYVTFQCYQSDGLQRLHGHVLSLASRARLTDVPTIWERNNVQFPPEKRENIEIYGYPDALGLYDPHFTIGRVTDADVDMKRIVSELTDQARAFLGYSFVPEEIVIYELGTDGACLNPRKM